MNFGIYKWLGRMVDVLASVPRIWIAKWSLKIELNSDPRSTRLQQCCCALRTSWSPRKTPPVQLPNGVVFFEERGGKLPPTDGLFVRVSFRIMTIRPGENGPGRSDKALAIEMERDARIAHSSFFCRFSFRFWRTWTETRGIWGIKEIFSDWGQSFDGNWGEMD